MSLDGWNIITMIRIKVGQVWKYLPSNALWKIHVVKTELIRISRIGGTGTLVDYLKSSLYNRTKWRRVSGNTQSLYRHMLGGLLGCKKAR